MKTLPTPKVSNEEFLRVTHGEDFRSALVCSFKDDPSNIQQGRRGICWHVKPFGEAKLIPNSNQYFCISTFHPDEQGKTRRRKALFMATFIVVLDDVLEKLPLENVNRLPQPTYKLQTSPGSIQYGYVLDTPCIDARRIDNLQDGLISKGLAPDGKDPGQKSTTRLMRLPCGTNTKASRVNANGGVAPRCKMLEWNPSVRVSLEDLAKPFGVDLDAKRRESRVDGAADLPDHPLLGLPEIIKVKDVLSKGRINITCPWVDGHTNKADDGAAVFTNNDGSIGYKCHHGSCQDRTGKDLLDFVERYSPGFRKKLENWKIMKTFNTAAVVAPTLNFMGAASVEDTPLAHTNELVVVRGSDIKPEPIEWLWLGWLAVGKFHVLAGSPGTGKTTIAISIAAVLTKGGRWPDGSHAPLAEVAIWSGEDDLKDTLAPRLLAARANMRKIHFIQGVNLKDGKRSFDPSIDMPYLRKYLEANPQIKMLIVDPVVSAVSGDSHKNTEVRRNLQPLVDLGQACDCAIFGISHFSKGTGGKDPVERVTGSIAFGALARIVLAAAKVEDDSQSEGTRLFARAKSNIGQDCGGWHYRLNQIELKEHRGVFTSTVIWGNAVEGSARELLAAADSTEEDGGSALDEAKAFLEAELSLGPMAAKTIISESHKVGINERTLKRAKAALKIKSVKGGMGSGWKWELPEKSPKEDKKLEHGQQNRVALFRENVTLRDDTSFM